MYRFGAFLFILCVSITSSFAQADCSKPRNFSRKNGDKIVGGRLALIANWPGQVALRATPPSGTPYYFCGGTLINSSTVLTAAHCVAEFTQSGSEWYRGTGRVEIVLQRDDLTAVKASDVRDIANVVKHESYQAASRGDDIAIIKLSQPWDGTLSELSLSSNADPTKAWVTPLMVAGFGVQEDSGSLRDFVTSEGKPFQAASARLLETTVPLTEEASCKKVYSNATVGSGQICAGFVEGEKDSCQGDSGGPLVAFDRRGCPYQVGVVSWGNGCAQASAYGIYTRVSAYADWIRKHGGETRAIALDDVDAPTAPSNKAVEAVFAQLAEVLTAAKGRPTIQINGGTKVKVGDLAIFSTSSDITGRLILIDINAKGEVVQLLPNQFVKSDVIFPGKAIQVPGDGNFNIRVQEPVGRGKLVAIVVPQNFNMDALNVAKGDKGFVVEAKLSYLQNLIQLIRNAGGAKGFAIEPSSSSGFGFASVDYEVIR